MINKKDIINFLLVISFPLYGFGAYVSAAISPSIGFIVSVSANLLIILFYLVDFLYKKDFEVRVNGVFFLMLLLIASSIISLVRSLLNDLPEENWLMTSTKSVMLIAPFMSFVVVILYNLDHREKLADLTFISLSLLLGINLIGFYGLGLSNEVHSIENRLNFPFLDGFYSGAGMLSIISLMIIYYVFKYWRKTLWVGLLLLYLVLNLYFLFLINSRISILIFLFVAALLSFRIIEKVKGLFLASLFVIPVLLVSGSIIYEVLKLPIFVSVLQRVDIEDITTFNGRAFLWRDAMDWLLYDQRGLVWGNGYKGHYFLDLISDVAKLWNEKEFYHMHLHSSSLEMLTSQGLVGFTIYMSLFYLLLRHYRELYKMGNELGVFFAVSMFLLFLLQVDTFVYLEGSGAAIFALLIANAAVKYPLEEKLPLDMEAQPGSLTNIDK